MALEIVTKEDLQEFKNDLLQELKNLLLPKSNSQKQWLRSADVKALLKISSGTLQNMRINGTLRYSKVGGTLYYNYEDIEKLLQSKN
ncbi:helix-turn-helix domain-containing protein [Cloacibacterium sp. TD35]|uniref:helix-turn-helix domain-containing protein n=1 Tax=Cloacibacterium sp. TD35 TaxID=2976818 RepID=UPI00237D93AA|nr:helix-turn-helix domain-containing protein [Cloacibacterium sp. TD35]WDT68342.1 helix-turn-helix domain-containing protein [Cloacibacterium sp. TD35]